MTGWPYDETKLGELLLYVASMTRDDPRGGAVKLNKYLYFADFAAMRILGHPITGAQYQKLSWGPAPRRLLPVRARLVENGEARVETRVDPFGYTHDHLVPLRAPRRQVFAPEELDVVDNVIAELRGLSASQVSALSHEEPGWQLVGEGETIPYELAFVIPSDEVVMTPKFREDAKRLLERYGDRV